VDNRARVLSATGQGVKRWEMVEAKKPDEEGVSREGKQREGKQRDASDVKGVPPKAHPRLLKVYLEYGVEDKYELTLLSELEMPGTSCKIALPTFCCVGGVKREKGSIGVEARTNVEVEFVQGAGMASVDTTELSKKVWAQASHPIILAYKFLEPRIWVELQVKKHDDVSVLIAVVESAHITTTQTEEGRILTKVVAKVRNTQQQFLRITTPPEASVWSTFVSGLPVKPARDKDGAVMIPLKKMSQADSQSGSSEQNFVLEFLYFQESKPMQNRGRLTYNMPSMDLPCNHLYISMYLPRDYSYGEFAGDIKETHCFSGVVPQSVSDYEVQSNLQNRQQHMQTYMTQNVVRLERNDSITMDDRDMEDEQYTDRATLLPQKEMAYSAYGSKRSKAAGVLPVKVEVPVDGILFRFEQLLVGQNSKLSINVDYGLNSKGCCSRGRRSGGGCIIL